MYMYNSHRHRAKDYIKFNYDAIVNLFCPLQETLVIEYSKGPASRVAVREFGTWLLQAHGSVDIRDAMGGTARTTATTIAK